MDELPRWCRGKESAYLCRRLKRHGFDPWFRKIPWRKKWKPTPVFWPEKFHGQRSHTLMGHSPWGCKESGRTEHTQAHIHTQSCSSLKAVTTTVHCKWKGILFQHRFKLQHPSVFSREGSANPRRVIEWWCNLTSLQIIRPCLFLLSFSFLKIWDRSSNYFDSYFTLTFLFSPWLVHLGESEIYMLITTSSIWHDHVRDERGSDEHSVYLS